MPSLLIFSERELTFTFAICNRPSICHLSETFVRATQAIEIFGKLSTPFGTLSTHDAPDVQKKMNVEIIAIKLVK